MAGPGVHLVVLARRSSSKKSRDAAFHSAADESNGRNASRRLEIDDVLGGRNVCTASASDTPTCDALTPTFGRTESHQRACASAADLPPTSDPLIARGPRV